MKTEKFTLVSDKFNDFAKNNDQAVTLEQLKILLKCPSKLFSNKIELCLGSGIGYKSYVELFDQINNSDVEIENIKYSSLNSSFKKIVKPNKHTHQRNEFNVLIGESYKIDNNNFRLPFNVDDRCCLLSDHQTGSHIQGMVISEAFRQSFIAIAEEYFLNKEVKTYFVINNMNISFINFVFPIPAEVHFELIDLDKNEFRAKFNAKIQLIQNDTKCAEMLVSYTVYPEEYISRKENDLARNVLSNYLA